MCRVYLLFTRLTLTSALWRMLGIQGGGHFSKHASKHNILRRDAIVDRSERLLGKCRVLTRRNSARLRIFHWGALVPSQYGCISQLHTIQNDIFSDILASNIPLAYPFRDSVFPFWWDATFCRFPSFKLQDIRVCFCQTCSFHILISVLGVGLFFAKSKERRYFHIEFQCPESSTNLFFINSFNGHKCSDLMP